MNQMFSFVYFFKLSTGEWLIYNVVLVSGVEQSESVIYIYIYIIIYNLYIYIIFKILFPYRLLCSIEWYSLCYIGDSYWLSILYIIICIGQA